MTSSAPQWCYHAARNQGHLGTTSRGVTGPTGCPGLMPLARVSTDQLYNTRQAA